MKPLAIAHSYFYGMQSSLMKFWDSLMIKTCNLLIQISCQIKVCLICHNDFVYKVDVIIAFFMKTLTKIMLFHNLDLASGEVCALNSFKKHQFALKQFCWTSCDCSSNIFNFLICSQNTLSYLKNYPNISSFIKFLNI